MRHSGATSRSEKYPYDSYQISKCFYKIELNGALKLKESFVSLNTKQMLRILFPFFLLKKKNSMTVLELLIDVKLGSKKKMPFFIIKTFNE